MSTEYRTLRRGDRLSNGAIIIDIKPAWSPDGHIVLALWVDDWKAPASGSRRNADPYVTWVEHHGVTTSGHYYDQLSQAVDDFNSRV